MGATTTPERILEYIESHVKERGYAPSQVQIASGLKISRQLVNFHFKKLKSTLVSFREYKGLFDNK